MKKGRFGPMLTFAACFLAGGAFAGDAPELGDYSGTYAFLQESVSVTKLPVVSDVVATTRTLSLHRLAMDGNRLHGKGTLCSVGIESSSGLVKTELPEAFKKALPPVTVDARLEKVGEVVHFEQAPTTLVLGAKLESDKEPLPSGPSDARVWDQDRDGHPGITVRVSGIVSGDIYLASRSTSSLRGKSDGRQFKGALRFRSEASILDATSSFLKSGPKAEPDLARSRFRLVPIPAGSSCADVLRVFGR